MPLEVVQEILFADSPILMSHVPHHRRTVINDAFDGEVAHNLADGLRGIDIDLIHIQDRLKLLKALLHIADVRQDVIMPRHLKSFYVGYDKRNIERDMGVLFISLCTTKKKS